MQRRAITVCGVKNANGRWWEWDWEIRDKEAIEGLRESRESDAERAALGYFLDHLVPRIIGIVLDFGGEIESLGQTSHGIHVNTIHKCNLHGIDMGGLDLVYEWSPRSRDG